ncbi:MAG: DUF1836 domain-containing protein [Eubacteriales bacterium]
MQNVLPGTTIEIAGFQKNIAASVLNHIFSAGGVVLSQVATMTELEPHTVQNWVKRGFVSPPVRRQYSRRQFARIVVINMMRQSLQIDQIVKLLSHVNFVLYDESDDTIDDADLYNLFVNLLCLTPGVGVQRQELERACEQVLSDFQERVPGSKKRVSTVLVVMAYTWLSALARQQAEQMLRNL